MLLRTKIDDFWALYQELTKATVSQSLSEILKISGRLETLESDMLSWSSRSAAELLAKVDFIRRLAAVADDSEAIDRLLGYFV